MINQLFQDPEAATGKRWYPIPETCDNHEKLNKNERRIHDGIIQLREAETFDPTCDDEQRQTFLASEVQSTACQVPHDCCTSQFGHRHQYRFQAQAND